MSNELDFNGNPLELKIVVMTFNIWHIVSHVGIELKNTRRLLADLGYPLTCDNGLIYLHGLFLILTSL